MAKQIDSTYGDALYELAIERGIEDAILEEVNGLIQVLKENEELLQLLVHPEVLKDDKVKLMQDIFKGKCSEELMGTLNIVVKNDRGGDLLKILDYVVKKIKEYKNIGVAYVASAVALNEAQQIKIEERLVATTKYDKIEAEYTVDPSLIGGLVIRIEDRVVDSSIKNQLGMMARQMVNS